MTQTPLVATRFEGHKAAVLSLATCDDEVLLLSGSEDQTARLWDLRDSKRRACLCIPTQGDVLSVAFASPAPTTTTTGAITTSRFSHDHTIFLSVDRSVLEYDLRRIEQGPIVTSPPTADWTSVLQHQDEVNQISLKYHTPRRKLPKKKQQRKGKSNSSSQQNQQEQQPSQLYLASADDAGTIRCMHVTPDAHQSHILHHDANGVAVVPTCIFRPGSALELASGGTDCKIHLWDVLKPKKPISSYVIQQPESGETNKPQVCNPPMVYSLAWSPTGTLLAAGLGDGNIPIFSIENKRLVQTGYLPDGHDSSVASVVFPRFATSNHLNPQQQERVIVSGGSDGSILCWDMGPQVLGASLFEEDETTDAVEGPRSLFAPDFLQSAPSTGGRSSVLFGIPHGKKVNWMTTSTTSIFVADTSPDITAYKVPLR